MGFSFLNSQTVFYLLHSILYLYISLCRIPNLIFLAIRVDNHPLPVKQHPEPQAAEAGYNRHSCPARLVELFRFCFWRPMASDSPLNVKVKQHFHWAKSSSSFHQICQRPASLGSWHQACYVARRPGPPGAWRVSLKIESSMSQVWASDPQNGSSYASSIL